MFSYALICSHMLSYAFICYHMLSYALICSHIVSASRHPPTPISAVSWVLWRLLGAPSCNTAVNTNENPTFFQCIWGPWGLLGGSLGVPVGTIGVSGSALGDPLGRLRVLLGFLGVLLNGPLPLGIYILSMLSDDSRLSSKKRRSRWQATI